MRKMSKMIAYVMALAVVFSEVCLAAYSITAPQNGSTRGKTEQIAAHGAGPVANAAVFVFGIWGVGTWTYKKEQAVQAMPAMPGAPGGPWSTTMTAPAGNWQVSPVVNGQYVGDHKALVGPDATSQEDTTTEHIVTQ